MSRKLLLFICSWFLVPCSFSQAPVTWTSSDMYLAIRKLNVLGSVLYVAAHPDDENTRLITYFSKDRMFRTAYLSITRGDGGQNLIGDEQGIELGLIRTQELLSARRIDGGEQFFTRAYDFGYSKTPEETFTKWHKEKILSDVVWVIRKFQPDVIITRFPTTGEGGHGHHTASAILANDAFKAAADPNSFPEQLSAGSGGEYVKTWQAKRILWNGFNFGGVNTTSPDQFKIDVGGYNPLLGKSYGEIAAESRSQHKSQGFGVARSRGEAFEYFKPTGGTEPVNDIMDEVKLDWKRVPGGESIAKKIDKISSSFDLLHPENSVKALVELFQAMNKLPDSYWKTQKLKETKQLIEQCSGLFLDAVSTEQFAVQTDSVRINFSFNNRLGVNTTLKRVSIDAFDSSLNTILLKNKNLNFGKTFLVPGSKPITQPFWLENKMEEGYYNVNDQQKVAQPDVDPAFVANITVNIEGQDFNFTRPVKYKFTDPVKGEIYWPLSVIPSYTLKLNPALLISGPTVRYEKIFKSYKSKNFIATIDQMHGDTKASLDSFNLNKNEIRAKPVTRFYDIETNGSKNNNSYELSFKEDFFDKKSGKVLNDLLVIKYDHVPTITYFKPSVVDIKIFSYSTQGKKIGYIVGAGDKVPEALEQMGYEVTLLTDKELSRNNLQQYDAIITGIRTYNTNEWMNKHYDKLMKYVSDGGNMIVQYNTSTNIGPVRARIGPYNFNIARTRVTDENAPVRFLKPDHPALNFPNKITQEDFKGWIQERSIYHASGWDQNFETIISMGDPGEKEDEGSLIIARHGKGNFVYTGLVFFRELPAGVPGAYRLLANLIALNKQKVF